MSLTLSLRSTQELPSHRYRSSRPCTKHAASRCAPAQAFALRRDEQENAAMKSIVAVHRGIHLCSKCSGWDIVIWAALAVLPQQHTVCFQDGCRPSRERGTCSRKSNGRPLTLQVRSPPTGRCRGSSHAGRPPILLGKRCRSRSLASCTSCAKPSSHLWLLAWSSSASSPAPAAIAATPLLTGSLHSIFISNSTLKVLI